MKILFSPIGGTDPITNLHDGSMLHICRVYRPDKIYMYLSAEMCVFQEQDDRYRRAIKLLQQDFEKAGIEWNCEIAVIEDSDLHDVQIFDAFIDKYEKYIDEIIRNEKPEELLLNVSSGTPAMKSSLQLLSIMKREVTAIQVSTPTKKLNRIHENKDNYDIELQWEYDEDREENFENRCVISNANDIMDRMHKENIIRFIHEYDYEAAKMISLQLKNVPSKEYFDCLELAVAREKLNFNYVNQNRKKMTVDVTQWFPIVDSNSIREFEYLILMECKLKKKRYTDFVRDITPLFTSLLQRAVEKVSQKSLNQIFDYDVKKNAWKLNIQKLNQIGFNVPGDWRNNSFVYNYQLISIIKEISSADEELTQLIGQIREVEESVRNMAAHQMMGVDKTWIEKKAKCNIDMFMNRLFKLANIVGIKISPQQRDAYEIMNRDLVTLLLKQGKM